MKYRGRTEIICDILHTANSDGNGASQTKIMYNAFLSHTQVKEYLTILIEKGLLQHDSGNQTYKTTEKGIRLLQFCNELDDMMRKASQL